MSNSDFIIEDNILKAYKGTVPEISIPEGIVSIGERAFAGCSSLTKVAIPESVSAIGKDAFGGCTGLAKIAGGDRFDLSNFRDTAFFMNYLDQSRLMFGEGCSPGERIPIEEGKLAIPEGVSAIGIFGFLGASGIREILIPKTTEIIHESAFSFCNDLTSIGVDAENPKFTSVDGVLFSKDMTQLIAYPAGRTQKSFMVPEGVFSIAYGAFAGCLNLAEITLPQSLSRIGKCAFEDCGELEVIAGAERFDIECFKGTKPSENPD